MFLTIPLPEVSLKKSVVRSFALLDIKKIDKPFFKVFHYMSMLSLPFLVLVGLSVWFWLKKKFIALTVILVLFVILVGFWILLWTQVIIN